MSVSIYFPCFIYFFRVWGVNWIDSGDAYASQEQYRDLLFWLSSCYGAVHYWFHSPPHFSSALAFRIRSVSLSSQQVSYSFPLLRCQLSFKSSKLLFVKSFSFYFQLFSLLFLLQIPPLEFCFLATLQRGGSLFIPTGAKSLIMLLSCFTPPDKWTQTTSMVYLPSS